MKISRVWLLRILLALVFIIVIYSIIRHVTGFTLGENNERFLMNGVVFVALGIFLYNRKIISDEKKERAEKEKLENEALERAEDGDSSGKA
jgi:type VI protein secretion system component VasK